MNEAFDSGRIPTDSELIGTFSGHCINNPEWEVTRPKWWKKYQRANPDGAFLTALRVGGYLRFGLFGKTGEPEAFYRNSDNFLSMKPFVEKNIVTGEVGVDENAYVWKVPGTGVQFVDQVLEFYPIPYLTGKRISDKIYVSKEVRVRTSPSGDLITQSIGLADDNANGIQTTCRWFNRLPSDSSSAPASTPAGTGLPDNSLEKIKACEDISFPTNSVEEMETCGLYVIAKYVEREGPWGTLDKYQGCYGYNPMDGGKNVSGRGTRPYECVSYMAEELRRILDRPIKSQIYCVFNGSSEFFTIEEARQKDIPVDSILAEGYASWTRYGSTGRCTIVGANRQWSDEYLGY